MTVDLVSPADDSPPINAAFLIAIDFAAEAGFDGLDHAERAKRVGGMVDSITVPLNAAAIVLGLSKETLVERVRERTEGFMTVAETLADGEAMARAAIDIIRSAQARLVIALQTVVGPDDDPGGGDELAADYEGKAAA